MTDVESVKEPTNQTETNREYEMESAIQFKCVLAFWSVVFSN